MQFATFRLSWRRTGRSGASGSLGQASQHDVVVRGLVASSASIEFLIDVIRQEVQPPLVVDTSIVALDHPSKTVLNEWVETELEAITTA